MRADSSSSFQFIFVTLFCFGNCLELSLQLVGAHATQLAGGRNSEPGDERAKFVPTLEDELPDQITRQPDGALLNQVANLAKMREYSAEFEAYKKLFRKHYANLGEQMYRFWVFNASYLRVGLSKLAYSSKRLTYYLELSKFSDLSRDERWKSVGESREKALEIMDTNELVGARADVPQSTHRERTILATRQFPPTVKLYRPPWSPSPPRVENKEEPVDWRHSPDGCLTKQVVDQGDCSSCYAITSMRLFEWLYCHKQTEKTPVRFSEQYLVDCGQPFGLKGCSRGNLRGVMNFVRWAGLLDDSRRPYTEKEAPCGPLEPGENWLEFEFNQTKAMRHPAALVPKQVATEVVQLANWLHELRQQPLLVWIDLTEDFFDYGGGLYEPVGKCDRTLGHFMLMVGFGHDASQNRPYWLLYNSFGPDFGELGYVRVPVRSLSTKEKTDYETNCLLYAIKASVEF